MFRCELCQQQPAGPDWLCSGCRSDLPWLADQTVATEVSAAASASSLPPGAPWPVTTPFAYDFPVAALINRYKHRRCRYSGQLLARLTRCHGEPAGSPDLLVPVPLSRGRLLWRGFNQAETLAMALSQRHKVPARNLLSRRRGGADQQQLRRAQRLQNLQQAFHCRAPATDLHVCLVDDVVTTGSTLTAAADALRQAGATRVSAWCLARTLPKRPSA